MEMDSGETRLVGDSIITGQLNHFCARDAAKRRRFCYRGAKIETLIDSFDSLTDNDSHNTNYILHIGTNDISNRECRTPELINKYKTLLQMFKDKGRKVTCSAVLPRVHATDDIHSRSYNFNSQLGLLCRDINVNFFSAWDDFMKTEQLFANDGLHLSGFGSARLGRLLNAQVKSFFQTAGQAGEQVR
jgi:lysophospholipase L1-like esterase